jgi:hypothetical protein
MDVKGKTKDNIKVKMDIPFFFFFIIVTIWSWSMMGHELQSSKPASPYRWMHSYLATNDLRVCVFLMDMLQTYLNWWIYRMIDDYMEWKVIIVTYLYKHFFHLVIGIYCQKRYGIYLWRWISFLEINALTSCITNTWRNLKQISSRDFANFRWYSLYFFST